MKPIRILWIFLLCLCLCGCELLQSGSHIYVETRQPQNSTAAGQNVSARNYRQLYHALTRLVENGITQQIISVENYEKEQLQSDLKSIAQDLCASHPIAAYAVEEIIFTMGTSGGSDALSVDILYLHDKSEIRRIVQVEGREGAAAAIAEALTACDVGIVLYVQHYTDTDFTQIVEDYAFAYPEHVMEQPQVSASVYPETGEHRVVELKFNYHTSRESLKQMQTQVRPVFESAVLYVSGDAQAQEKYSQLFSFLMERYEYTLETSITPTYSLLRHGVGDVRAFATVYAAMCRLAGLECITVSGTYAGESRYWNLVKLEDGYYHVDLLRSSAAGVLLLQNDEQMRTGGYLWNFDYYPASGTPVPEAELPSENN